MDSSTPFSMGGRSVVVTGGTRGIGRGIAAVFAGAGARVLVTGRDTAGGERAARQLTEDAGQPVAFVAADAADPAAARRVAAAALDLHGGIDVVCANAGIFPDSPLHSLTVEDFDRVYGSTCAARC